ncbi:MAG: aldo/keto reductase [Alphaproteobacteria bacterium]|nr:aldo/keto reductase [Alphaproteobacteria bacterium]
MIYNKLGGTDIEVSRVCLGTMTWGRQNTEAEGHAQMDYALSQGVHFFDTAEMYAVPPTPETYGKTETIIGTWFQKTGNRDKIVLASKIVGPGIGWIREGKSLIDRKNIALALEASLKRLQTDYIDLYQLHWPNRGSYHFGQSWAYMPKFDPKAAEANFIEVLETLGEFVRAGKIRAVGLSNETAWGTMKWLQLSAQHSLPRMASIQNEYSLVCRMFEPDLQEISLHEDIGLLAWSPLGGGMISGKYLGGARPAGTRWSLDERKLFRDTPEAEEAVKAYMGIAAKYGLDVCQMALAFVNAQPFVCANIIGATSMEQLKSNIASINLKLPADVLADIEAVRRRYPQVF